MDLSKLKDISQFQTIFRINLQNDQNLLYVRRPLAEQSPARRVERSPHNASRYDKTKKK